MPTNQHHVTAILQRSFDVAFVESTGLRRPELKIRDATRIARRVARRPRSGRPVPVFATPDVVSPVVFPWHGHSAAIDAMNRRAVQRAVAQRIGQPPDLVWAYTPITFGFDQAAPVVYHCVDLLGEQLGVDAVAVERAERRLAAIADVAIASSRAVEQHLIDVGFRRVELWENVADAELFVAAARSGAERFTGRVLFAGNLAPNKVDVGLLEAVSELPGVELVIAGPVAEGGGRAPLGLDRLRRARFVGALPQEQLAQLAASATVGIIPYLRNGYTSGVFPLKVYEYLGAGLRVVATDLPSLVGREGVVCTAADEFVAAVARAVRHPLSPAEIAAGQELGLAHSWTERSREVHRIAATTCSRAA